MEEYRIIHSKQYWYPTQFIRDNLITANILTHQTSNSIHNSNKTRASYLLLCVVSGKLYLEQYAQTFTITAGQGVFINLNDAYTYYSDTAEGAEFYTLSINGKPLEGIVQTLSSNEFFPLAFNFRIMKAAILKCFDILSARETQFEYTLSMHLYQLILEISSPYLASIQKSSGRSNSWFIRKIEMFIFRHIEDKITIQMMADALQLKPFHVSRLFVEHFHITPTQYVISSKISHSKKLLTETSLSVGQIAHSLGFSDQSHFCKTFKRCCGITPLKYRQHRELT
ncbi:AraC family transcriptional regulator [Candidatus Epulonipiscium viviparus]|uniref:AraC family transcriptional regulator n=1 Tax=Candidatus Epulonipiscium viviparus TaxID=420336 RepID=UPI00016C04C0|nr:AraC family transcriptional regulator [Candidatus Epulopiscium viviparus]